jgi:hypothetical protein
VTLIHSRSSHMCMYIHIFALCLFAFQPTYFADFPSLSVCAWLLTESLTRVRECVYHLYVYGTAVYEPVLYAHLSHVFGLFHFYCILTLLDMHIPAVSDYQHTCHACARTDAHATGQL